MADSSNQSTLDTTTIISALLLATPPTLALLAAAFPAYVPIPFVQISDQASLRPVLIAVGLGMLVINIGFLVLIRRMLSNKS